MQPNRVKAALKAGEIVSGPIVAETRTIGTIKKFKLAGHDFLFLDMEHAMFDWETMVDIVQASLAYDISQLPRQLIAGGLRRGERIYVRLAQDEKGSWQAVAAGRTPAQAGSSAGGVVLMGHVRYAVQPMTDAATAHIWVAYGIEKFFVPEGTGREIEAEVRASDVMAHVAVASDGTAALKGLTVAGERIEMPPLFPK